MVDNDELERVRRDLDTLVVARSVCELKPMDQLRYLDLCAKERVLLGMAAGLLSLAPST
jgi:hypothetical protein